MKRHGFSHRAALALQPSNFSLAQVYAALACREHDRGSLLAVGLAFAVSLRQRLKQRILVRVANAGRQQTLNGRQHGLNRERFQHNDVITHLDGEPRHGGKIPG